MSRETTVVASLEFIHPSVHGILILFWEICSSRLSAYSLDGTDPMLPTNTLLSSG